MLLPHSSARLGQTHSYTPGGRCCGDVVRLFVPDLVGLHSTNSAAVCARRKIVLLFVPDLVSLHWNIHIYRSNLCHSAKFEGFVLLEGLRDQICAKTGHKANCVRQVGFL